MKDEDCVRFLQWALPRLRMRWPGFRKVRGQVCKRIARRLEEIDCSSVDTYRALLTRDEEEWHVLDALCRVTISRFYRDRRVFDTLRQWVLPELAERAARRGGRRLRCFCAGCASGEEPYTVSLIWRLEVAKRFPPLSLEIVATDTDRDLLSRARRACYPESSLRDLPRALKEEAFSRVGEELCLGRRFREGVDFRLQDVRSEWPEGFFDLLLCRNLVFTYFDTSLQREIGTKLVERIPVGGALVVGRKETPLNGPLEPWLVGSGIYRKRPPSSEARRTSHPSPPRHGGTSRPP